MAYFSTGYPAATSAGRNTTNTGKKRGCKRYKKRWKRRRCRRRRRGSRT